MAARPSPATGLHRKLPSPRLPSGETYGGMGTPPPAVLADPGQRATSTTRSAWGQMIREQEGLNQAGGKAAGRSICDCLCIVMVTVGTGLCNREIRVRGQLRTSAS